MGLNFGPGPFLGFVWSPKNLGGFDFASIRSSLSLKNQSTPPPSLASWPPTSFTCLAETFELLQPCWVQILKKLIRKFAPGKGRKVHENNGTVYMYTFSTILKSTLHVFLAKTLGLGNIVFRDLLTPWDTLLSAPKILAFSG